MAVLLFPAEKGNSTQKLLCQIPPAQTRLKLPGSCCWEVERQCWKQTRTPTKTEVGLFLCPRAAELLLRHLEIRSVQQQGTVTALGHKQRCLPAVPWDIQHRNGIHKCKGRALPVARAQFHRGLVSAGPVAQGWLWGSASRRAVGGSCGCPVEFGIAGVQIPWLMTQGAYSITHRAPGNSLMQFRALGQRRTALQVWAMPSSSRARAKHQDHPSETLNSIKIKREVLLDSLISPLQNWGCPRESPAQGFL